MSRQKRRDTAPEMKLRSELHRSGLRFRVGLVVPGRPRRTIDVAFTRQKLAVFVDGCFWHGCPEHATWPRDNADWWRQKLEGNKARDVETDALLRAAGWQVVRVWEHAVPQPAANEVIVALEQRRAGS